MMRMERMNERMDERMIDENRMFDRLFLMDHQNQMNGIGLNCN